ncbi:MAG: flagellar motor protein MotB [Peptostreptococcaceae bacterium]
MARKEKKGDDVNPDAWLGTYADAVTLLMAFFVVLFSISSVDSQKLKELHHALQEALTGKNDVTELEDLEDLKIDALKDNNDQDKDQTDPSEGAPNENTLPALAKEDLKEILEDIIEDKNLADTIKLVEDERGIILQLHESLLFDSGFADLKATPELLEALYMMIGGVGNDILIEGNTDDIPINTVKFPSNWELSTARAVSVARYFIEEKEMSPIRISVKGFGEYNPIADNETPENRSLNRRVDILILDAEGTTATNE